MKNQPEVKHSLLISTLYSAGKSRSQGTQLPSAVCPVAAAPSPVPGVGTGV